MSRNRSKGMLDRCDRLPTPERSPVIIVSGDPEIGRLQWFGQIPAGAMQSEREMVVGEMLFAALPEESTIAFERRMVALASERGIGLISQGSEPVRPIGSLPVMGKPPAPLQP
jgi:hypothetical protein